MPLDLALSSLVALITRVLLHEAALERRRRIEQLPLAFS